MKTQPRLAAHLIRIAALVAALAPTAARAQSLTDGVTTASFAIDPTVGPVLVSVGDAREATAHRFAAGAGLWALKIFDGSDIIVEPADASCASRAIKSTTSSGPFALDLLWLDCSSSKLAAADRFDVKVHATLSADHALSMIVEVVTRIPAKALRAVEFPRLSIRSRGAVAEQVLTYPYVGGWLFKAPLTNPILQASAGAAQALPGALSMQWWSYYDRSKADAAVLFFGTRDARGNLKEVILDKPTSSILPFRLRHVVPVPVSAPLDNDYKAPFAFVLRVLRGGWLEAADFYRAWATTQPFAQKGPMRSNASFSKIIRGARVFAANTVECASKPCDPSAFNAWRVDFDDQHKRFGVSYIPQLQYGWHHGPALGESGDWLPIVSTVASNGPTLKATGDAWAPYFYNLSYNVKLPTFLASDVPGHIGKPVLPHAVKKLDQTPVVTGGSGVEPTVLLCPHTQFMRDYTAYIAKQVHSQAGAQGVYLDVFNVAPAHRCYDPTHGHPLGGGDFYMQGLIATARHLRSELRKSEPQFFVYSEGLNEMLLGEIELGYTHLSAPVAPAPPERRKHLELPPLFEAVYGDYMMITSLLYQLKAPAFKALAPEVARGIRASYGEQIHQGAMPPTGAFVGPTRLASVVNNNPPWQRIWSLALSTVDVIKQPLVADFFVFGRRRRDPVHDAPIVEATPNSNDMRPQVLVSSWRSDTRAGVGLLLVNWTSAADSFASSGATGGDVSVGVTLDAARLELTAGDYDLVDESAQGSKTLKRVTLGSGASGAVVETIKVGELGVRFVRLVPAAPPGADGGPDGGGSDSVARADSGPGGGADSGPGGGADSGPGGTSSGGCAAVGRWREAAALPQVALLLLLLLIARRRRA